MKAFRDAGKKHGWPLVLCDEPIDGGEPQPWVVMSPTEHTRTVLDSQLNSGLVPEPGLMFMAHMRGPQHTVAADTLFCFKIVFSKDWPFRPPKIHLHPRLCSANLPFVSDNGSAHIFVDGPGGVDGWSPANQRLDKLLMQMRFWLDGELPRDGTLSTCHRLQFLNATLHCSGFPLHWSPRSNAQCPEWIQKRAFFLAWIGRVLSDQYGTELLDVWFEIVMVEAMRDITWLGGRDRNHRNIEDVQANLSRAIIEEKICHENMRELLLPTSP